MLDISKRLVLDIEHLDLDISKRLVLPLTRVYKKCAFGNNCQ